MIQKILFVGATGMLGKPVIPELVKAGFEVTAMVRDIEAAKKTLPAQVRLIKGDLKDKNSLENAVANQDAIYLNLSITQTERRTAFHTETDGLRNLLEVIKGKNIQRLAYLSSLVQRFQGTNGFHWWVFDVKQQALELIKNAGIPYTIFYPSNFMESLCNLYKQGNRMLLAGKSKEKMYFIAGSDYGRQVAKSFQIQTTKNKEYDIQGLESYTADEAVQNFVQHYRHAKLSISRAPLGVIKFAGNFSTKMSYAAHILEALNNYPEPFTAEPTWTELGKPHLTLQDFITKLEK